MKLSAKNLITSLGAGATLSLVYAKSALAQAQVGNQDIRGVPIVDGTDLLGTINGIVNVVLIVVGILAVMYLIYGGILYITAGGNPESAVKGRTAITNAIIGIIIVMLSLAIYNFVIDRVR